MAKKRGLGRAFDSIMSEVSESYENVINDDSSQAVVELSVNIITPNKYQPRQNFDEASLKELADSIMEHGLLQPITVSDSGDGTYELVAGERRLRATKIAGLSSIKAIVADVRLEQMRELALIENIQREDLNSIDLALAYRALIQEHNLTHDELAQKVKKSRAQITNTMRLLNLSQKIQDMISSGKITQGHAKILVGLDEKEQKIMADSIIGQNLSVQDTEEMVRKIKGELKSDDKNDRSNDTKSIKDSIKKHTKSELDKNLLYEIRQLLTPLKCEIGLSRGKITLEIKNNQMAKDLIQQLDKLGQILK